METKSNENQKPLLQSDSKFSTDSKAVKIPISTPSISEFATSNQKKKIQFSTGKTIDSQLRIPEEKNGTFLDETEEMDEINLRLYRKKVIFLFDQLFEFESRSSQLSGIYYIIIVMICSSVLINIADKVEHDIPGLQLLFIIVLVSFILNYYLIREGHINPYLETEEAHSKAKLIGFLAIISIGTFFYAIQTSAKSFVLFLLFTSWLIAAIIERCFYKEAYSRYDTLASLIVLGGAVIVNIPLIQIGEGDFEFTQDFVVGIIMGLISCVSTGFFGVNFSKLGNFNILSINHVVLLIVLLFIPLFFPIQGLIPPNFLTWIVTILLGFMFFFIMIFFIRSLQLEKATIILLYLNLLVAANIIIETIFVSGILNTLWSYLGAALIVFGLVLVGREAFTRVETQKVRDSFSLKSLKEDVVGENKKDIEMVEKN